MSRHLEREITKLKKKILKLGRAVEESITNAVLSIKNRDAALARKVILNDIEIDKMEVNTEEECLKILALHQPVAIDLRFIIGVLKMNSDFERMADLASNIAERSLDLAEHKRKVEVPKDIFTMAEKVKAIVEKSMKSMINMSSAMSREVCNDDDEIDELHKKIFADGKIVMSNDKTKIETTTLILSISRYLERIADHATNIAEDVVYMVEGIIHRHVYKFQKEASKE
ncbi:phosphate signaling complex protein PhoU [bacterium]|nr:phosphate signaling complex protein PhoU [bacterium]